jgi:transcriptional regulator with XRE-family HTH domain
MIATIHKNSLSAAISNLIELKNRRDNVKFTVYKLAQETGIDRSVIQRIINGDIENPRSDTFFKIVNFFINDGFKVNIEEILSWKSKVVDIQSQTFEEESIVTLPLYEMDNFDKKKNDITVMAQRLPATAIAVVTNSYLLPIFEPGSVFIVDLEAKVENRNLVMVKIGNNPNLLLRQFTINRKDKIILQSYKEDEPDIEMNQSSNIRVIGVIVKINAKLR